MKKTRDQIRDEALEIIKPRLKSGLGISMGVGKTLIGLTHLEGIRKNLNRRVRALVVAPKKSIFDTWAQQAEEHGYPHLIEDITFSTYRSLLKQDLDYDVIYLDECHSLLFSHKPWLREFKGTILGLTGTPPAMDQSEKGRMVTEFCPIVYTYITDDAVDDDILNDYRIVVHMLSLDREPTILIEKGNKKWYSSEVKDYTYWTDQYNNAMHQSVRQQKAIQRMKSMQTFPSKEEYAKRLLMQSKHKCLLFANTKAQADKLCSHSYHSGNKNSQQNLEDFRDGKITKMSCVLQLNEGANITDLKESIIMHSYGNERKTAQRIGRTLRLNPNDTAIINILCYKNTVDEKWVIQALGNFDDTKISWYDTEIF